MKDIDFTPQEIYNKRERLGKENSIRSLLEIVDVSTDKSNRRQAIQYLRSFEEIPDSLKLECFDTLEAIIVSDKDIELKCEAATSLGKLKIEMGLEPLKWLLEQEDLAHDAKKKILKAIHDCRFEKPEIEIFLNYLDSSYNTIRDYVKNALLNLSPENAIHIFLNFMAQNISEIARKELIKLIGYELSGLNVSYDGNSYLKTKYPEILSNLIDKVDEIIDVLSILKERDTELLDNLLIIFNVLDEHATDKLLELLDGDDFIAKENAIKLIGRLGIKEASPKLLKNIDNMYSDVSIAAINALGEIGEPSIIPELLKALDIEDTSFEYTDVSFKWNIIESIKRIYLKDENVSYEFLIDKLSTSNEIIKETVAYILGELAHEDFVKPLIETLKEWHNIDVAKSVIVALGKIGDLRATKRLLKIINNDQTYWLLKKITVDSLYNIIKKNWHYIDKKDTEQKRALVKCKAELEEHLNNNPEENHKIKLAIIKLLQAFGDKDSISVLMKRLNDFHRIIRISAQNAIKTIEERLEDQQS